MRILQVNDYPVVPKDFITAPIFAAKPQEGSRTVVVNNKKYTIGGFKPISEDRAACPALDIRHGRALFTILSYVDPFDEDATVRFSIRDFCRRYASAGWTGSYARNIRAILSDLERCWFKVQDEDGISHSYRILKNISIHQKAPKKRPNNNDLQEEIWIDEVEMHPEFLKLLRDYMNTAPINLRTLTRLTSSLAQAIYAYIPSRAIHNTKAKPFEITLTNILSQVGFGVPGTKSERKKIFTQNKKPILSQLDSIELVSGKMRTKLIETADGRDYKLQFWVEKENMEKESSSSSRVGALLEIWLQNGKSHEDYRKRTKHPLPELSSYHEDLMERAKVETKGNIVFFRQALALLGESTFTELLADAKAVILEGRGVKTTPTKRLIHYIKEALKERLSNC